MISDFARAVGQLPDRHLRNPILLSILASLTILAGLGVLIWLVLDAVAFFGIGWLDQTIAVLGGFAVMILLFLFLPGAVGAMSGLFVDRVAAAVERRHYPGLPPARPQPWSEAVWPAIRLLLATIALNLLCLPLYIILPGLNAVIFYLLNGYLLGREFFESVASRRLDPAGVTAMRRRFRWSLLGTGVVIALLMTVPLVNLAAPVIATAFLVHRFERLRIRQGQ